MSKYDQIVKLLLDNWIIALLILFFVIIMAIPQVREGLLQIHKWINQIFIKGKNSKVLIIKISDEEITCTSKMRSLMIDVIEVDAFSHHVGIQAEHKWIERFYPKSNWIKQALTEIDHKYFDIITIQKKDGTRKEIYFNISKYFNGKTSSIVNPDAHIARKIREIYKKG